MEPRLLRRSSMESDLPPGERHLVGREPRMDALGQDHRPPGGRIPPGGMPDERFMGGEVLRREDLRRREELRHRWVFGVKSVKVKMVFFFANKMVFFCFFSRDGRELIGREPDLRDDRLPTEPGPPYGDMAPPFRPDMRPDLRQDVPPNLRHHPDDVHRPMGMDARTFPLSPPDMPPLGPPMGPGVPPGVPPHPGPHPPHPGVPQGIPREPLPPELEDLGRRREPMMGGPVGGFPEENTQERHPERLMRHGAGAREAYDYPPRGRRMNRDEFTELDQFAEWSATRQHLDPSSAGNKSRSRRKLDSSLRNDSLSSDPSDCVRPPPPKPHKHKRGKKQRQASLSSSEEEIQTTPECTSCDEPEIESESVSEKGRKNLLLTSEYALSN